MNYKAHELTQHLPLNCSRERASSLHKLYEMGRDTQEVATGVRREGRSAWMPIQISGRFLEGASKKKVSTAQCHTGPKSQVPRHQLCRGPKSSLGSWTGHLPKLSPDQERIISTEHGREPQWSQGLIRSEQTSGASACLQYVFDDTQGVFNTLLIMN